MVIAIDPRDSRPIYVQIADEVKRGIVVGALTGDEALPSVRQLAETLRVNPNTVQQAYRELERSRLVYVRRGQGTFVDPDAAGAVGRERDAMARRVARKALQDAFRNGIDARALIEAIRNLDAKTKR